MIDLKKDTYTILNFNSDLEELIKKHKDPLLAALTDDTQRLIIRHYLRIIGEFCRQACECLKNKSYSTLEALSRVVMEQSANKLYVGMDEGDNGRALLRSSNQLIESNGKAWAAYLESQDAKNPAAQARQKNGSSMLSHFNEKWADVARYPGGKGLFKALGWENTYYAYYAPLCDSVHSFSDEMSALVGIGEIFEHSEAEGVKTLQYWDKERRRLAVYHFAVALGLRAEAFARLCELQLGEFIDEKADKLFTKLRNLIESHDRFDHARLDAMSKGSVAYQKFPIKVL
ncbi:hypothetical protein [Pseudomonas fluorescens]|uniref:hypothetical protein n=1 Tax=Pseudomonas fluorescens TaxID=294 RepID=UPI000936E4C5|nr:hypothetical protein [Pseudomonas fluorescens]